MRPPLCEATGKRSYTTENNARNTINRIKNKGSKHVRDKTPTYAYRCGYCTRWHLTSQPRRYR